MKLETAPQLFLHANEDAREIALEQDGKSSFSKIEKFRLSSDRDTPLPNSLKPFYSIEQAAARIMIKNEPFKDLNGDGNVEINYQFMDAKQGAMDAYFWKLEGFSVLGEQQQAQAKLAMQSWSDVANIHFTEGGASGDGQLNIANYGQKKVDGGESGLTGRFVAPTEQMAYTWLRVNDENLFNKAPELGSYARETLVHELGHALGLSHPGFYQGSDSPTYDNDAFYAQDSLAYSVMSYWREGNTSQDFNTSAFEHYIETYSGLGPLLSLPAAVIEAYTHYFHPTGHLSHFPAGPMMDDIAAIQQLYGANLNTRTDDTTYGFNSTTDRDFLTVTSSEDKVVMAIWDGGGNDTLDFHGYSQNQKINLNEASFSNVGGLVGNVSVAKGVTIENAIGGSGNDWLLGNSVGNELKGGAGDDILFGAGGGDTLWGGAGADIFLYAGIGDSAASAPDKIMDFVSGVDKIDLSEITRGSSLKFVSGFTGAAGEAMLTYSAESDQTSLAVDFSGIGSAGFLVTTVGQMALTDIVA